MMMLKPQNFERSNLLRSKQERVKIGDFGEKHLCKVGGLGSFEGKSRKDLLMSFLTSWVAKFHPMLSFKGQSMSL